MWQPDKHVLTMAYAGIAQRERGRAAAEVAGSTPAPRSIWHVSAQRLAEREAAQLAYVREVYRRFFVPGMPLDHVRFRLACYGLTIRELRGLLDLARERRRG